MADFFRNMHGWWGRASAMKRLVCVNVAVFLLIHLGTLVCFFGGLNNVPWLMVWGMPADVHLLATHWWTPVVYMVSHYDVLHILFNMLWLYWMGDIFVRFYGGRRVMALYVYGGLAGALAFALGINLLPGLSPWGSPLLLGASASVMAIVVATAVLVPNLELNLLFIGGVKLKWIAIVTVVLFIIGLEGTNAGGHLAHLGGVLMGVAYGLAMRRGVDISRWFNHAMDRVANMGKRFGQKRPKRKKAKVYNYRPNTRFDSPTETSGDTAERKSRMSDADQRELDAILDKVKRTGYAGLTDDEKRRLFQVSRKIE